MAVMAAFGGATGFENESAQKNQSASAHRNWAIIILPSDMVLLYPIRSYKLVSRRRNCGKFFCPKTDYVALNIEQDMTHTSHG